MPHGRRVAACHCLDYFYSREARVDAETTKDIDLGGLELLWGWVPSTVSFFHSIVEVAWVRCNFHRSRLELLPPFPLGGQSSLSLYRGEGSLTIPVSLKFFLLPHGDQDIDLSFVECNQRRYPFYFMQISPSPVSRIPDSRPLTHIIPCPGRSLKFLLLAHRIRHAGFTKSKDSV